ncbi:MAG: hypothetical protein UW06_C0011G0008 [Parcubacteria group bacterium GW2011_GWE1_43_8]|nr:MAG: hypothetical protein UV69_C0040G0004 [Parcubacteria group bacterium GW2011_GWE2_43_12]KKT22402.1 MAG: hypothetical protein UW06_C0011G0008 [Parcubacteria group bacterium GW2011_GWE1_43_8]
MRKHFLAVLIIVFTLVLGYGLWLYSESLRTGESFAELLKDDIATNQQAVKNFISDEDK